MGGRRLVVPLFIVCQREGCNGVRSVPSRWVQNRGKYCSRSCAAKVRTSTPKWKEAIAAGLRTKAAKLRAEILKEIPAMSPLEAFRVGYLRGLQSKRRQFIARRRRTQIARPISTDEIAR